MVIDQAAKLREQSNRCSKGAAPRVIAVTSGKGGVGKTNLVANLGICLAEQGFKVVLLDADFGMANLDVILGVIPKYSLFDAVRGERLLSEVVVQVCRGLILVPGAAAFNELVYLDSMRREQVETTLKEFTEQSDFILIDTGAGISKSMLSFVSASSEVILVMTPEPTSMTDAYGLLKIICRMDINQKIYLVVNMAESVMEATQAFGKMAEVAGRFLQKEIQSLGYILDNNCVGQAVREQVPFVQKYPKSRATLQVKAIARALVNGPVVSEPERTNFVSKLSRFLG